MKDEPDVPPEFRQRILPRPEAKPLWPLFALGVLLMLACFWLGS